MDQMEVMDFIPSSQAATFKALLALGERLGLKTKIQNSKKGDTLKYTFKSKSKNIFSFKMDGRTLDVKPCLWNIDGYREELENSNETIKTVIINAHECTNCSERCGKGAKFTLDDQSFYKCIVRGFSYKNPNELELNKLSELIILESEMRTKK
ncbi:MAG: hypothetical protein ACOH15_11530 [Acetobacterium sp.]